MRRFRIIKIQCTAITYSTKIFQYNTDEIRQTLLHETNATQNRNNLTTERQHFILAIPIYCLDCIMHCN